MARARRRWHLVTSAYPPPRRCVACGTIRNVEFAHILGREHDDRRTGVVHPDDIVLLCGPTPAGCHGAYDAHELDIAPFLNSAQIDRAIALVGAGQAARRIRSTRNPEPLPSAPAESLDPSP